MPGLAWPLVNSKEKKIFNVCREIQNNGRFDRAVMMPAVSTVQPGLPSQVSSSVGLLMTDDLLVATQGAAQRDVRPSSGPPEQPRVGTDTLSQHVSGARRTASPGRLEAWKPGSLGTPGRLGQWLCDACQSVQGRETAARLGHLACLPASLPSPPRSHNRARGPRSGALAG